MSRWPALWHRCSDADQAGIIPHRKTLAVAGYASSAFLARGGIGDYRTEWCVSADVGSAPTEDCSRYSAVGRR